MTAYEYGFLTKCAECGLDANTSVELLKGVHDATEFLKSAKDSNTGAVLGGSAGGLAGLLAGDAAKTGFKGIVPFHYYPGKAWHAGASLRKAMAGGSKVKLMKLLKSPKGKLVAALLPILGTAGGAAVGGAAGSLLD